MTDGDGAPQTDSPAPEGSPGSEDSHIPKPQLFALVWAIKQDPPAADGEEGEDPQLTRALRHLDDEYSKPFLVEQRLGPETVARYRAHQAECEDCRRMLLEDGPEARRPQTPDEKQAVVTAGEEARKQRIFKFWRDIALGVGGFGAAQTCFIKYQQKRLESVDEAPGIEAKQGFHIDPLIMGFAMLLLFAAWFLAEAWVGAKELNWFNFTNWKRAVPVVGKAWAEKSIERERQQRKKD